MRAAYALATVFFFLAPASNASLPPYEQLRKELYDDEQARLYDNPLDFKAAATVKVGEPDTADAWARFDQGIVEERPERVPILFNGKPQKLVW